MSEHAKSDLGEVNIDALLEELHDHAIGAKHLSEEIRKDVDAPSVGDKLIDEVSKNLATIRRASDLPDKDAADIKARIKGLQDAG